MMLPVYTVLLRRTSSDHAPFSRDYTPHCVHQAFPMGKSVQRSPCILSLLSITLTYLQPDFLRKAFQQDRSTIETS